MPTSKGAALGSLSFQLYWPVVIQSRDGGEIFSRIFAMCRFLSSVFSLFLLLLLLLIPFLLATNNSDDILPNAFENISFFLFREFFSLIESCRSLPR